MKKEEILKKLEGVLIVSCQALSDEPLYSSFIMSKMAYAASLGGARGVRANTPEDIKEIKKEVELPIIGLYKQVYDDTICESHYKRKCQIKEREYERDIRQYRE